MYNIWPITFFYKYFDFLKNITSEPINLKKEKKNYNFFFLDMLNENLLNFCIFYWFLIIPYFFFEYIMIRYHFRGHSRIKNRWFVLFKILLNKFKLYIKIFKIIGDKQYSGWKVKYPKNYIGINAKTKKKLKIGYFLKFNRFVKLNVRVNTIGSYYYWFLKINRSEYILKSSKYFFNFSYKSNYFYYVYIYIFMCLWIKYKYIKEELKFKNFRFKNVKFKCHI